MKMLSELALPLLKWRESSCPSSVLCKVQPRSGEMPGYYYHHGALDQRAIVWPKLQVLKRKHLADMEALYERMAGFDTQVLSADHARKFNLYKEIVRRLLTYLRVTKETLPLEFKQDSLDSFAEQIVTIIEIFRKKPDTVAAASSLPGDLRRQYIVRQ